MSAFMCSDEHIGALIDGARHYKIALPEGFDSFEFFAVLVAENKTSLTRRYGGRMEAELICVTHRYTPEPALPVVHVIKLAQSYAHQACEHDGWNESEAKKWIDGLIYGLVFKLPEYDTAPWSI